MRVAYLAGPMRGVPLYNFPAFYAAAADLCERGYAVFNPALHDEEGGFDPTGGLENFSLSEAMRWDLSRILESDLVVVLPGWETSAGTRLEMSVARAVGVLVVAYPNLVPIEFANMEREAATEYAYKQQPETPEEIEFSNYAAAEAWASGGEEWSAPAMTDWQRQKAEKALEDYYAEESGEVRITAETGGQKGRKPERFELIPWGALEHVARLYGEGASKYAEWNWRKGYDWTLSLGAAARHLSKIMQGEDTDAETGSLHAACVCFHMFTLMTFMTEHPELDDRYKGA